MSHVTFDTLGVDVLLVAAGRVRGLGLVVMIGIVAPLARVELLRRRTHRVTPPRWLRPSLRHRQAA